jgi:preprotein translocase subunit SecF
MKFLIYIQTFNILLHVLFIQTSVEIISGFKLNTKILSVGGNIIRTKLSSTSMYQSSIDTNTNEIGPEKVSPEVKKEKRRLQMKTYYDRNKNKIKEQQKVHKESHKDEMMEYQKRYREANKGKCGDAFSSNCTYM